MAAANPLDLRNSGKASIYTTTTDDGAANPATRRLCFFDLPAELRLEIYELAFTDYMKTCQRRLEARANKHANQLRAMGHLRPGKLTLPAKKPIGSLPSIPPLRHPLLRANKTVSAEALPTHLNALTTYLEDLETAERETLGPAGLSCRNAAMIGYVVFWDQQGVVDMWPLSDREEFRPAPKHCLWWTLRSENDRASSELNSWYECVKWVDGDGSPDWRREDRVSRAGLRMFPIAQGLCGMGRRRIGPRHHTNI